MSVRGGAVEISFLVAHREPNDALNEHPSFKLPSLISKGDSTSKSEVNALNLVGIMDWPFQRSRCSVNSGSKAMCITQLVPSTSQPNCSTWLIKNWWRTILEIPYSLGKTNTRSAALWEAMVLVMLICSYGSVAWPFSEIIIEYYEILLKCVKKHQTDVLWQCLISFYIRSHKHSMPLLFLPPIFSKIRAFSDLKLSEHKVFHRC